MVFLVAALIVGILTYFVGWLMDLHPTELPDEPYEHTYWSPYR